MAKNIVLKNSLGDDVTYQNVGKIILKDDSGSNVEYVEKPNIPFSDDASPAPFLCQLIDYDGTVIKSEYLLGGEVFKLPTQQELPVHENLVFQQYSSPVEIIDNSVSVNNQDIVVGITYTTVSGLSEFDIQLNKKTGLTISFMLIGSKDWGDGTTDETYSHTYSNYGKYTIKCGGNRMNGSYIFSNNSTTGGCLKDCRLTNLTEIYNSMFSGCKSLETVTLSNTITKLNYRSFQDCYSLKSISLPNGLTTIGEGAFGNCSVMGNVSIPSTVTSIGRHAFIYCYALKNISLPNGLTSIGESAFDTCKLIEKVNIPNTVVELGKSAFYYCQSLKSANLPSLCSSVNDNIFSSCKVESPITIPDGVTTIGTQAFNGCLFSNITIPQSVTSIGDSAFSRCSNLTTVTLPNNLTSMGQNVFSNCYSLTKINIPQGITSINTRAFENCYSLMECDFSTATTIPSLGATITLNNINPQCKIIVPDALYDSWITATNWSTYAKQIYKVSEV